jgi:hypothetical protein
MLKGKNRREVHKFAHLKQLYEQEKAGPLSLTQCKSVFVIDLLTALKCAPVAKPERVSASAERD